MLAIFFIAFTAYVNPYLALLPGLGHTDALRINLGMMVALSGLVGMVFITVLSPEFVSRLQVAGT